MTVRSYKVVIKIASIALVLFFAALQVRAQSVEAGRYDNGKMWAFEYPPLDYLAETYDFRPDDAWFDRARMSVLRIPGCSASFVSPNGLVVTNHHCVRSRVSQLSGPGEGLLDNGFYAPTLDEERRIPGYYADQLIAIEDITDEVYAALEGVTDDDARNEARTAAFASVTDRIESERTDIQGLQVQIIGLYSGGRYSAYIFKRYSDVRLVFAVELQLGFFGGDGDNFTYPRYALDYSFLRIYGDDGRPVSSPDHFTFSEAGVEEGDLVFVIGNPGSTRRQATVSELEFYRDVMVDHTLRVLNNRLAAYHDFYAEDPVRGEEMNLRNTMFSISNSQKAYSGRDQALKGPWLIARRADGERQFRDAIMADPELRAEYGTVFGELEEVQTAKLAYDREYGAFRYIESSRYTSGLMLRSMLAARYLAAVDADTETAGEIRERLLRIVDRPAGLEVRLLTERLREFEYFFGADVDISQAELAGLTPEEGAVALMGSSALATGESTAAAVQDGTLTAADPGVAMVNAWLDRYTAFRTDFRLLEARERELQRAIGQARFAVYGVTVPSDATFSPRFTDGVVKGYPYNGTLAPPYTTLFGLMDHYYSYGGHPDWTLPARWQNPPADLDLSIPLNFISTSDTIGGNSGSPAVTRNLEIVGLNFDRNIEGLSRDYIFLPEQGRNIMVDMRSVKETLDKIYDADRIVLELTTGYMAESEEEADSRSSQ